MVDCGLFCSTKGDVQDEFVDNEGMPSSRCSHVGNFLENHFLCLVSRPQNSPYYFDPKVDQSTLVEKNHFFIVCKTLLPLN